MTKNSPQVRAVLPRQHAFRAVTMTVMLVLVLCRPLLPPRVKTHWYSRGREDHVLALDAKDPATYELNESITGPALFIVGNSQQFLLAGKARNDLVTVAPLEETIVGGFAKAFAKRYPSTQPATFVRISTTGFNVLEEIAAIGLWLQRSPFPPNTIVLSFELPAQSSATMRGEIVSLYRQNIAPADRFLEELRSVPEGSAVADDITRNSASTPLPLSGDGADEMATRWLDDHGYFETRVNLPARNDPNAMTTIDDPGYFHTRIVYGYQKIEAPILRALFGKLDQAGPDTFANHCAQLRSPEWIIQESSDFGRAVTLLAPFIHVLRKRDIQVLVYTQPWNGLVVPIGERNQQVVEETRRVVEEAGAMFIDGANAVPPIEENWGWFGGQPDITHMSPRGVKIFAQYLLSQGETVGAWTALREALERGIKP